MMSEYQLTTLDADGPVLRTADQAHIPNDPANRDWIEYQNWLALGNVPDPYVPPEPGPPPPPDPNLRLDTGVNHAVDTYNANTPARAGGQGGLTSEERLLRIEETVKAMCNGQMLTDEKLKWAP
jgi:hypothetical protein